MDRGFVHVYATNYLKKYYFLLYYRKFDDGNQFWKKAVKEIELKQRKLMSIIINLLK